ncbi:hypothetical protein OPT61_g9316 [Boeremia exigua]|uniref:Uncharacterized protein n=1 Tax=Boeremia exigua TaxID=749465 RepID=A0ACC2HUZ3_9PLEO|nr:hypothetical protein OPT61_g9316 [Boeremia exigua]
MIMLVAVLATVALTEYHNLAFRQHGIQQYCRGNEDPQRDPARGTASVPWSSDLAALEAHDSFSNLPRIAPAQTLTAVKLKLDPCLLPLANVPSITTPNTQHAMSWEI